MIYLGWAFLGLVLSTGGVFATIWCFTNDHWGYVLISVNGIWTGAVMISRGWGHYKLQMAIDRLSLTIEHDPNFALPYFKRARCYYMKEKWDLALADLGTCVKLADDPSLNVIALQLTDDVKKQKDSKKNRIH